MPSIQKLTARQILDSRGNPTIEVSAWVDGDHYRASVPSGASTGVHEAKELRDGGRAFGGLGVQKAIRSVSILSRHLQGMDVCEQEDIDSAMIELDGTSDKSRLGANAILGASLAVCRAAAGRHDISLYWYIGSLSKNTTLQLPVPFMNIINGGKHAGNGLAVQEFMIAPVGVRRFSDGLRMGSEIYHALKSILIKKYGRGAVNVGDEGGFAPPLSKTREALDLIEKAIASCGYQRQVKIAIDAASSEFFDGRTYHLDGRRLSDRHLLDYWEQLSKDYALVSLEDPFHQEDFLGFAHLTQHVGKRTQIVGDDLLVTNLQRLRLGLHYNSCTALLLKPNQIGTVSESLGAAELAQMYDWKVMVSHRSGETTDDFIADLAVGLGTGQIKAGAPGRGERVAKYNRLLAIEEDLGSKARYGLR